MKEKVKTFYYRDKKISKLVEIVETKKIISVIINIEPERRRVRRRGLWGKMGFNKTIINNTVEIRDPGGIHFSCENQLAFLDFNDLNGYYALSQQRCLLNFIKKDIKETPNGRITVTFRLFNLFSIDYLDQ